MRSLEWPNRRLTSPTTCQMDTALLARGYKTPAIVALKTQLGLTIAVIVSEDARRVSLRPTMPVNDSRGRRGDYSR